MYYSPKGRKRTSSPPTFADDIFAHGNNWEIIFILLKKIIYKMVISLLPEFGQLSVSFLDRLILIG
jgi:hypothetical protein